MHPHVSGTEHMGFLKARHLWEPGSQNSDICVRTWNPVLAIPKLGKIQIFVSGHETRSNRWIFPFLPFAEGVCCERPLDVIIIPTDGHTTVRFFFQVVIIFVLVLVQIDLIHFESTSIKTNTYPLREADVAEWLDRRFK